MNENEKAKFSENHLVALHVTQILIEREEHFLKKVALAILVTNENFQLFSCVGPKLDRIILIYPETFSSK